VAKLCLSECSIAGLVIPAIALAELNALFKEQGDIGSTRHGPSVELVHRDKDGEKIADVLGQEAFEVGADMMATGAFGHSRAYDFVIGAATRSLLSDAKLPVMFSK